MIKIVELGKFSRISLEQKDRNDRGKREESKYFFIRN